MSTAKQNPEWYAKYYAAKRETILARMKEYSNRPEVRERGKANAKKRHEANPDRLKILAHESYWKDPEKMRKRARVHGKKNRHVSRKYQQERLATDLDFRLRKSLRSRMRMAIKDGGGTKRGSALSLLGCTPDFFRSYIETKWKPGMTWENWSFEGWHMDHIKPLALYDLTQENQLKEAFHYTNFQPLWKIENLAKGARSIG